MKQVAPAPAPAISYNWSGFYIGGFGGYKFSNVDVDFDLRSSVAPAVIDHLNSVGSRDLDNDGAELGGLLGYNWQFNCWVLGLEADAGYLWARKSSSSGTFLEPVSGHFFSFETSFKTRYLATLAPRIGCAFGRFLPYVTGGLAVGDLDFSQRSRELAGNRNFPFGGDRTETNAGWMVGGGLQYAITEHWSVRGQYQYIDLGSVDFDDEIATAHHEASLTEHNASFAIIYKF
jgi:outer membrane immunogenic protein